MTQTSTKISISKVFHWIFHSFFYFQYNSCSKFYKLVNVKYNFEFDFLIFILKFQGLQFPFCILRSWGTREGTCLVIIISIFISWLNIYDLSILAEINQCMNLVDILNAVSIAWICDSLFWGILLFIVLIKTYWWMKYHFLHIFYYLID